jgi:hypothetical protein
VEASAHFFGERINSQGKWGQERTIMHITSYGADEAQNTMDSKGEHVGIEPPRGVRQGPHRRFLISNVHTHGITLLRTGAKINRTRSMVGFWKRCHRNCARSRALRMTPSYTVASVVAIAFVSYSFGQIQT